MTTLYPTCHDNTECISSNNIPFTISYWGLEFKKKLMLFIFYSNIDSQCCRVISFLISKSNILGLRESTDFNKIELFRESTYACFQLPSLSVYQR